MKNRIDYNNDGNIVLQGTFQLEVHSKESFIERWTEQCTNFYRLVSTKDQFDIVDRFKSNVKLIASIEYDKILDKQLNKPLEIKDNNIIDRT